MYNLHKGINHFYANTTTDAKKGLPDYVMKRNTQKLKIGFVGSEYMYNNIRGAIMYFIHSIFVLIDFNKFDFLQKSHGILFFITNVQANPDYVTFELKYE
jgi:hypothetical protein